MTQDELRRWAIRLANWGDQPALEVMLRCHDSPAAARYVGMLSRTLTRRFNSDQGVIAPVVGVLHTLPANTLGGRPPVSLVPLRAYPPHHQPPAGWTRFRFNGSVQVTAHAAFAAAEGTYEDLTLFGNHFLDDGSEASPPLQSFDSAALAAFLVLYATFKQLPLPGWVGASGVLPLTAHAGFHPPVAPVSDARVKVQAMLDTLYPSLGLVLIPESNRADLTPAQLQDARVKLVSSLQQVVDLVWPGRHLALGELRLADQVRHLEAEWFHAPFSPQRQQAVLSDAARILARSNHNQAATSHATPVPVHNGHSSAAPALAKDTLTPLERVICLSIKGHYHSHRGELTDALACFDEADRAVAHDNTSPWPTLDAARRCRLDNAKAVAWNGMLYSNRALSILRSYSDADLAAAGEEGRFLRGTLGQVLTSHAAQLQALHDSAHAEQLLTEAAEIHRQLIELNGDAQRHRCYLSKTLALLGRTDEALDLLVPMLPHAIRHVVPEYWSQQPATAHNPASPLAHAPTSLTPPLPPPLSPPPLASISALCRGLVPQRFAALRLAHLFWLAGKSQQWVGLCHHIAANLPTPGRFNLSTWPDLGVALHHSVMAAEAGLVAYALGVLVEAGGRTEGTNEPVCPTPEPDRLQPWGIDSLLRTAASMPEMPRVYWLLALARCVQLGEPSVALHPILDALPPHDADWPLRRLVEQKEVYTKGLWLGGGG